MKRALESLLGRTLEVLMSRLGLAVGRLADPTIVDGLIARLRPVSAPTGLVRLGPVGDGGYLVPDDLDGIAACFSPGVGAISAFEMECAKRGMSVFLADGTVDGPAESHASFRFVCRNLGAANGDETMTLDAWVDESTAAEGLDRNGDLMLQMDIEGAEWEVLLGARSDVLRRFRVIVVEFHHLELMLGRSTHAIASAAFERLLEHHVCVHVHPNNAGRMIRLRRRRIPQIAEFTFLRRDRFGDTRPLPAPRLPHPLDVDNVAGRPTLVMPSEWHS